MHWDLEREIETGRERDGGGRERDIGGREREIILAEDSSNFPAVFERGGMCPPCSQLPNTRA